MNNKVTKPIPKKSNLYPKKNPSGHKLDTLAELYESTKNTSEKKEQTTKSKLYKRARSKFFTNGLILKLVDVSNTSLSKSYWNSYHCASVIQQENEKMTSKYCNNRWCQVCNRIRTAKTIKGYLPQIQKFTDPYFITLTRPNVLADTLQFEIDYLLKQFRRVYRHFIDSKQGLRGIRKIECTYNPTRNDYHPHLHLIVDGKEKAEKIVELWLKYNSESTIKAQDTRPIQDDNAALELFKYFTKLTTKETIFGKSEYSIHPYALNVIFESMRLRRVYQPMGIKKINTDVEPTEALFLDEKQNQVFDMWLFSMDDSDWVNTKGKKLTGYKPNAQILELLNIQQNDNTK